MCAEQTLSKQLVLKNDVSVPRLGQGTWYLGQGLQPREQELAALRRGIERRIALMAYCPLAQGGTLQRGVLRSPAVLQAAEHHGATPAQVLLNFVLQQPDVIAIPRSSAPAHTEENAAALDFCLTAEELTALDRAFPAPNHPTMLDIV